MLTVAWSGVKNSVIGLWSSGRRFYGVISDKWHSDGRVWTWWMTGEQCLPEFVVSTVKFGGACVMV